MPKCLTNVDLIVITLDLKNLMNIDRKYIELLNDFVDLIVLYVFHILSI
jgi:hypothetical protein